MAGSVNLQNPPMGYSGTKDGQHWLMAGYLLLNGVMAPALLAQPYVYAVMGWGGATAVNIAMALASWYCMYHQATLFHYQGGRHSTYKSMGNAILSPYMGRWGGVLIASLQYFINLGSTTTNIILAGQLLQSIYTNLCTNSLKCTSTNITLSGWIGLGGVLTYAIFIALPDMSTLAWASICGSVFAVYYCIAGMVMAGLDGNASSATYTITGPPATQVFNALNGIGICLFLYGITVLPEIQGILADDHKTGSTTWPMTKAATAVHCVFVPLYMLVGSIGFWAYGTTVNPFLLFASRQPLALVVSAEVVAAIQLQLVSQVMMIPVFEAFERLICRLLPYKWLSTQAAVSAAAQATDDSDLGMCKASQLAGSFAELEQTVSRTLSNVATSQLGRMFSTSRQASYLPQSFNTPTAGHCKAHAVDLEHNADSAVLNVLVAEDADGLSKSCPVDPAAAISSAAAADCQASPAAVATVPAARRASLFLRVLTRTVITGCLVLVACALPFFGGIMGFFGAVGFGPVTYALPTVLYMVAFGSSMSRLEWCFNLLFIMFWIAASLLGAVGSVYAIVTTASSYTFFS